VEFLSVFMWLCLALFAAAAVIWLLDMVGVVTIRSSAQRTMLNASLGTTLLGGMASFAVSAFFTSDGATGAGAAQAQTGGQEASAPAPGAGPPPSPPSSALPPAAPTPPPAQTACRPAAHPAALADWAAVDLGTPPTFRCAIAAPYPVCIADLRELPRAEIAHEAALACGAALLAFRKTHISAAYAAKLSYQDNLDAAEASLRTPRNADEQARRSYVITEIGRMNGELWKDFTALDQRSKTDMLACQSNAQRCLTAL
jgi:hypothetical protein